MGKGKKAGSLHFLLFPIMFSMPYSSKSLKDGPNLALNVCFKSIFWGVQVISLSRRFCCKSHWFRQCRIKIRMQVHSFLILIYTVHKKCTESGSDALLFQRCFLSMKADHNIKCWRGKIAQLPFFTNTQAFDLLTNSAQHNHLILILRFVSKDLL